MWCLNLDGAAGQQHCPHIIHDCLDGQCYKTTPEHQSSSRVLPSRTWAHKPDPPLLHLVRLTCANMYPVCGMQDSARCAAAWP
jgi:hypothetical protein